MLAPLLAAQPLGLTGGPAAAIDPAQTQVTLPEQYQWKRRFRSAAAMAETTAGSLRDDLPGPVAVRNKWYPGHMRAIRFHIDGTRPAVGFVLCRHRPAIPAEYVEAYATMPAPRQIQSAAAHTPPLHRPPLRGEPAIIGIFGEAPIQLKWIDPS